MTRAHLILTAKPHRRGELLALLDRLELRVAADESDLIQVELYVPLDDPDRVLAVSTWPSPAHYARWSEDGGLGRLRDALRPLLREEPETGVYRLVDATG